MKNLLLTLAIVFSYSVNAQYAVMYAVDLNEGGEEDYLSLEKFWSEIHSEALNQGLHDGWSVWKRTPKDGDQESAAEYFIFENYSSIEQMQKGYNALEIATKVYKGKKSRRYIQSMVQGTGITNPHKERRVYTLQGISATILAGGSVKPGDVGTINLMVKKSDDFENYESQIWKPVAEKNIMKGSLRQWVLAEVINRSDNAYQDWTHLVWNLRGQGTEFYETSGFIWDKLWEGIESSRDMSDATELTCIFAVN